MRIEQKLDLFLSGNLKEDKSIGDAESLRAIGILQGLHSLSRCLFEENITLASPTITKQYRTIFFGSHSYMNDGGYVRDYVFVGRYCSIGRRVTLGAGCHNYNCVSTSPILSKKSVYTDEQTQKAGIVVKNRAPFLIIENDVWIGDGAVILPGVRVATGAVVGANSVVTSDVDPYWIVGGVPARPLRRRFSDVIVNELLLTEWWNFSSDFIRTLPTGNVFNFIEQFHANKDQHSKKYQTYSVAI